LLQTNKEFFAAYRQQTISMNATPADFYAGLTYDAVWAIGLALNGSMSELATTNKSLADFNYDDSTILNVFMRQMYKLKFPGQSVRYSGSSSMSIYCVYIM
jgi:hypothetical protein